jgi:hypothetical protein
MLPGLRPRTRLWLGALAAAGVAATHILAFLVAEPHPEVRREVLAATGHGYWDFTAVVLGALVAGLVGFVAERVPGSPPHGGSERDRLWLFLATRLALLQALGFLGLEAAERLAGGDSVIGVLQEPVVLIGLVVQAAVAVVAALLLVLFAHFVERIYRLLQPVIRPPKVAVPHIALRTPRLHLGMATGGLTLRGPPA